jgi:hypothetical protein
MSSLRTNIPNEIRSIKQDEMNNETSKHFENEKQTTKQNKQANIDNSSNNISSFNMTINDKKSNNQSKSDFRYLNVSLFPK